MLEPGVQATISPVESEPLHISAREVQRLKPQIPEAQAEVTRLVSEGTPPDQAIHEVVEQLGSPPPVVSTVVEPIETPGQVGRIKGKDLYTGFLALEMKRRKIVVGNEPLEPPEPPVRPEGHEARVRKLRDAVIALYELANEVYDLSGSDDECIDNLRLIDDDASERDDSRTAQDIRKTVGQLAGILDW